MGHHQGQYKYMGYTVAYRVFKAQGTGHSMPIPKSTTNAETARQRSNINRTSRTCSAARLLPLDLAPGVGWVLTPAGCSHPKAAPPRSRSRRRAQNHSSPKVKASLAAALSARHKTRSRGLQSALGSPSGLAH